MSVHQASVDPTPLHLIGDELVSKGIIRIWFVFERCQGGGGPMFSGQLRWEEKEA